MHGSISEKFSKMIMVRFPELVFYNNNMTFIAKSMTHNISGIVTRSAFTAGIFNSYPDVFRDEC